MNFDHYGNFCFSSLENNMTHSPFFRPDFNPLQPAVRKPQKVLERAQEMAGSNLKEKKKKVEEQGSYLWQNVIFSSVSACIFSQHVYSVTPSLPSFPWVNISALE